MDCQLKNAFPSQLSYISEGRTSPMSQWNDDALVYLREKLMLNVLMSTGLSSKLEKVTGGFMSRGEAQMVRQLPNSREQIDRVIDILRGKGEEDFQTFCVMLRESNNAVWADELEREAEHFKAQGGKGTCVC